MNRNRSQTQRGSARLYGAFLIRYLRPQVNKTALLFVVFLAAIALDLWLPAVLAAFIDQVRAGENLDAVIRTAVLFLGIGFAGQLIRVWEAYIATDIGLTVTNRLRADLARHCLRLDIDFHSARTPGELIERVDGDPGVLNRFFSRFITRIVGNALLLLGVLALLFRIDVRVGWALTGFTAATLLLLSRLSSVGVRFWSQSREVRAKYFGFIEERLAGTEDIRANGAVGYVMRGLAERMRRYFQTTLKADAVSTSAFGFSILLFALGTALALGIAAGIYLEGSITLGTAYLIFSYTQLLTQPIEEIIREFDDLQEAGASVRRIDELLQESSSLQDGAAELMPGALALAFSEVSFTYRDAQIAGETGGQDEPNRVLREVSFDLPAGKSLGLLGRTGSGKTTLTRLMIRFFDPQQGVVRLGGRPLAEARLDSVRERVGVVTQEVQLFNASLRDNLTFFDRSVPDEHIWQALEALELKDWVAGFPDGLDTLLQSGGEGFSAGEAQLLAFARVFLKDPGLVILDEASSRLDPATEARLERSITRLLEGRTAVIIAHRLSTVERSDSILIMEGGRVDEFGDRAALAGDPGSRFARLLAAGMEQELAA